VENLVIASRQANNAKRAFLVAPHHLAHWHERNRRDQLALQQIATAARWETRPDETLSVVRAVYLRLPDGIEL
jgi:hypothetical protein